MPVLELPQVHASRYPGPRRDGPARVAGDATADGDLRRMYLAMIDAVLTGEGVGRVAALAARELGGEVAIVLPGRDVAVVEPPPEGGRHAALRRYAGDRLLRIPGPAPERLLEEEAIVAGGDRVGLVLLSGHGSHPRTRKVVQLAALAAATAMTLDGPCHDDAGPPPPATLLAGLRAADVGDIVLGPKSVGGDLALGAGALCVRGGAAQAIWTLATIAEEVPSALAACRGDDVEALLPTTDARALRLAGRLRLRAPVGLAPFEPDVALLGRSLRSAELAAVIGERDDLDPGELLRGSWRLLLRTAVHDRHEIDAVIDATVGPAVAAGSRTDLVRTLRGFLQHDACVSAAASAMRVHRQTIGNRLRQVAELTGHDPHTAGGQTQLSIGLKALTVRDAMAAVAAAR